MVLCGDSGLLARTSPISSLIPDESAKSSEQDHRKAPRVIAAEGMILLSPDYPCGD